MGYDPVTVADHAAEAGHPRRDQGARIPTTAFTARSTAARRGTSQLTWVIDPIDGTKSFILGQLHWAMLIALHDGTRAVVGVAHQPFVGETFLAIAGGAAQWRRGDETRALAHASLRRRIEDAVVATTDPRQFVTAGGAARRSTAVSSRARLLRYGGDCYCYSPARDGTRRRRHRERRCKPTTSRR